MTAAWNCVTFNNAGQDLGKQCIGQCMFPFATLVLFNQGCRQGCQIASLLDTIMLLLWCGSSIVPRRDGLRGMLWSQSTGHGKRQHGIELFIA